MLGVAEQRLNGRTDDSTGPTYLADFEDFAQNFCHSESRCDIATIRMSKAFGQVSTFCTKCWPGTFTVT